MKGWGGGKGLPPGMLVRGREAGAGGECSRAGEAADCCSAGSCMPCLHVASCALVMPVMA